jgi:2-dehydro-3-deoxyphosphooctonate aldolase (KDO 8-P synthase)
VFDAGHSIRKYGIPSKDQRGSARQFLGTLARAAVAAGVDGFFIEAHPSPPDALCDAASQYALEDLESFMRPLIDIHNLVRSQSVH